MVPEETIQQRVAEVQSKIDVPSYQDVAWDGAWKRRAGAIWGVAGVATVVGLVTGLAAPFFTVLAGMELASAAALLPKSVAVFSALGLSSGLAIGAVTGPGAGAAASTMKEYERRQLARKIEEEIRRNPEASVELIAERVALPEQDKPENARWSDYFKLKTGLVMAAIGAVGGLIFAGALLAVGGVAAEGAVASFGMPALKIMLGEAAKDAAMVVAYSMGLGACFGANFGVSHALITRKAVNFANKLLSGEAVGGPWPKSVNVPEPQPVITPVVVPHAHEDRMEMETKPAHAAKFERAAGYESIAKRAVPENGAVVTRG